MYSKEKARTPIEDMSISSKKVTLRLPAGYYRKCPRPQSNPGSTAFTPSVMGLIMAGEIVNDIALGRKRDAKEVKRLSIPKVPFKTETCMMIARDALQRSNSWHHLYYILKKRYVRRDVYVNHYYLCYFSCDLFLPESAVP